MIHRYHRASLAWGNSWRTVADHFRFGTRDTRRVDTGERGDERSSGIHDRHTPSPHGICELRQGEREEQGIWCLFAFLGLPGWIALVIILSNLKDLTATPEPEISQAVVRG